MVKNKGFNLSKYFPILQDTIQSFRLNVNLELKNKTIDSHVQSAFLKADIIEYFLLLLLKKHRPNNRTVLFVASILKLNL